MAVGYWKTPTEATYLAPGDTSQNQHIEGLPFGTRGGMLVRHNFPGRRRVQVLDPELRDRQLHSRRAARAHHRRRASASVRVRGRRVESGHVRRRAMESLDVTDPGESGLAHGGRHVPGDELPAQPRHDQAIRPEVAREQQHPAAAVLPGDRLPADSRPVHRPASDRLAQHPQGLYLPARPSAGSQEETVRRSRSWRRWRGAPIGVRSTAQDRGGVDDLLRGRPPGRHVRGRHRAGAAAAAGEPAVPRARREGSRPTSPAGQPIASAIWNWRLVCRSSCGAAFRTTS